MTTSRSSAAGTSPHRATERIPAAQKDFNRGSIAICLHGLERARFTTEQALSLVALCDSIHGAYAAIRTELRFRGHCEVASKTCPVFDYATVLGLNLAGRVVAAPQPARIAEPPAQAASADVIADPDQLDLMDRGVPVRRLQTALNRHGARLRVDGIFGQLTREAVIAFQRGRGLAADGIAGPETRAALGLQ
jgi:N-acetylmuramoyl-L-alanine amidase